VNEKQAASEYVPSASTVAENKIGTDSLIGRQVGFSAAPMGDLH